MTRIPARLHPAQFRRGALRQVSRWLPPVILLFGLVAGLTAPAQAATYWQFLGFGNTVNALALDVGGNLYAGSKAPFSNINRWDGAAWQGLGQANQNVLSLAFHDATNTLYAGGYFTFVSGVPATYVARRTGSGWSSLGSGVNNAVMALELDAGGNLYAGGDFTMAGGAPAGYVARWNGSAWQTLGAGTNNIVYALEAGGGNLYAGGSFWEAGGASASRIARWNGSAWQALGSGINNTVYALAFDPETGSLYAGGTFTMAGGVPVSNIARWNGSAWQALGTGINGAVLALALDGDGNLYAGGEFTLAGGVPAVRAARWDGIQWSAVAAGTFDNSVRAFAFDAASDSFYAGGDFTGRIARLAEDNTPPTNPTATTAGATSGAWTKQGNPLFALSGAADAGSGVAGYYWYFGPDSAGEPGTWTPSTSIDPAPVADGTYYLRVKTQDAVGHVSAAETVFVYRYDGVAPSSPTITEIHDLVSGAWHNHWWEAPAFTFSGASDSLSGLAGYAVCWDAAEGCAPTGFQAGTTYSPGSQMDGRYTLRVVARDQAGNESPATEFVYALDATPPANPAAAMDGVTSGEWTSNADPLFTLSGAIDSHSGVIGYKWYFGTFDDHAPDAWTDTPTIDPEALMAWTGTYYLRVAAVDAAGNEAYPETVFVYRYDNDPPWPSGPVTDAAGSAHDTWQGTVDDPAFTWPAWADVSGIAGYAVYFGPEEWGAPEITTTAPVFDPAGPLEEGTYYLNVIAVDNVGRSSLETWWEHYVFRYDTTAPGEPGAAAETHGAQSGAWQSVVSAPSFTWAEAADAVSAVSYDIYFGPDPEGVIPVTTTASPAYSAVSQATGIAYLRVRARDGAGNTSEWVDAFTFQYDDGAPTAPTGAVELGGAVSGAWEREVCQPEFTWDDVADADSGLAGYEVYFGLDENGTAVVATTASAAFAPGDLCNSDGTYYLRARALDVGGNRSDWTTLFTFRYDGMAPNQPTASVAGVTSGQWQNTVNNPVFALDANDWQSGIAGYKVCWSTTLGCSPTTLITSTTFSPGPVETGQYFLTVVAVDSVGHESTPWSYLFFYDDTAPVVPTEATDLNGSASDVWQNEVEAPRFRWADGEELDSGLTGYDVYFGPDPDGTSADHFNGLVYSPGPQADGTAYLRVRAKDLAGNASPWTTLYVFRYDSTPPGQPGSATDAQGSLSGVWQDTVSAPEFTWTEASDAPSGVAGYQVYWGRDPEGTTVVTTTASAVFAPGSQAEGIYYLRVRSVDMAGNAGAWGTLLTFQYDANAPEFAPGYTAMADSGVISGTWSTKSSLNFTWAATDAGQGVDHYEVYFGLDPAGTTAVTIPEHEGVYTAHMADQGLHYLRLRAVDGMGHQSEWITAFIVGYDTEAPSAPTSVTAPTGVEDGVPQSAVNAPTFTWSGASDAGSGIAGYLVYFGPDPNGTPTIGVAAPSFTSGVVESGAYSLRVVAFDGAGNDAAPVTLLTFVYSATPHIPAWTVHLPLVVR